MSIKAKTYCGEGLPEIEPHQFSVVQADVWTGKVLTLDGLRYAVGGVDDKVLIFDSLEEAEGFASQRVTGKPDVECWVHSHDGQYVRRFVNEEGAKRGAVGQPSRRAWWKFW